MSLRPDEPSEDRSRWHLGGLLSIRADAALTDGMVAVVEEKVLQGYATPPHVHSREDEILCVLSGEIEYAKNGVKGRAGAGESVFLPRNQPHNFEVVSPEAHFFLVVTPAGFEGFFREVSPAAETEEVPAAGSAALTEPRRMAEQALRHGCRIFGPLPETLADLGRRVVSGREPAELDEHYATIEELIATSPEPLPFPRTLVADLITAAGRAGRAPVHARAFLSLGIIAERTGVDFGSEAAGLLTLARDEPSEAVSLGLSYLFAHFPGQAPLIEAALSTRVLAEPDRLRLLRCLRRPDFSDRAPLDSLGRVWPTPGIWTDVERAADQEWRDALELDEVAIRGLWDAETQALLAFLGGRAEHAIIRGADVRS
ncbi:hypothetical protein DMC64_36750 [Amycolatopsis sp. WAC 04197]|uniref:cupin domain-containing protein n=1 Tax=Amycolatopsis sp. WAC 04197 TaxID=2203199 RepID=UPI000F773AF9|nr:cupin domain-containing protein [Amycolatopsis sp. WAC 04197]RSN39879.1 hypothetical protein DMC64_36750 [Amycolatopsis sp. WAC 04197]